VNLSQKILSFVAAGSLLGAIGCSETTLVANPGATPPTRVNAEIQVETDHPSDSQTLDFGEVYAGETREKEVTITNIGTDTLQIQDLILSNNASFQIVNDGQYDVLLVPDASTVVLISYSPVQDEHIEGTLIVASNDREAPEVPVRLLAEGLAPAVDIQPPSFDFGNHELGCVNQVEITIANVGRAPLVIDEIYYDDLSGSGELTLANNNLPTFSINPNEATTVTVHYIPTDVQPDSGLLHVLTNTPAEPVDGATAQQFGIAHLGENNLDQYMQEGNNSTDILFTIDNSCTMIQEQTAMAVNFAAFLQIIQALDIDYHLGVTSTDIPLDQGYLQGSVTVVNNSTPDPGAEFSANVNLGTSGDYIEQGFESAHLALEMADNGTGNTGFLREDAGLRIIFVSDEQDQSSASGPAGWAVGDYVSWFQSLKPNPDYLILSDITGGMAGCQGAGGSAEAATEYVLATAMTGGISASICDPNWVSTLSALGWLSQSFADTFELSQTPVENTIELRLNDVLVYVGWIYDSALNAVVFDSSHVPDNGDVIEISYTVVGVCVD